MTSEADYRRRAEALLCLVAAADNMRTRGDLIDEAGRWHALAMTTGAESDDSPAPRPNEPASFNEIERRRPSDGRCKPADRSRGLFLLRWFLRLS